MSTVTRQKSKDAEDKDSDTFFKKAAIQPHRGKM